MGLNMERKMNNVKMDNVKMVTDFIDRHKGEYDRRFLELLIVTVSEKLCRPAAEIFGYQRRYAKQYSTEMINDLFATILAAYSQEADRIQGILDEKKM